MNLKNNNQSVSVVIPCLNEKNYIIRCLNSINNQSYPKHLITTFICDGNSDDGTQDLIKTFNSTHSNFTLLNNEKKTTPFALNLGINTSNADIIIILGAHSELDKDYIFNCIKTFEISEQIMCVGGLLQNVYENQTSKIIGTAMSSSFGVGNAHFRTGNKNGYVDTVAFGAYRREIFSKVGLFDEELIRNQDDEFNYRITSNGYKIYLNSEIKCKYFVRASFLKLFKQYYQYGYWKVFVNKKHKTITTVRQLIPMFFVIFLFNLILSLIVNTNLFFSLSIFLLLYIFLALFFAFKLSSNLTEGFKLSFTFCILHISYGSGYIKGIFDFFLLGKKIKQHESLSR